MQHEYISNDDRNLRKAKQIDNSCVYFETNLSANNIISFIKDLMIKIGLELDDFSFSLSEVPFDITSEETWQERIIPVAKLFYYLIEDLVRSSLISSDEINKLKTKEYTKNLFPSTDYSAVANNREDNKGNSSQKRIE